MEKKKWSTYVKRVGQYFIPNAVKAELQVATLLTAVGDETYELMVDLCSPAEPETKTYAELVEIIKNHLEPEPSEMAEQYKFQQRTQLEGETITKFVAALKHLARTCMFGIHLDKMLRNQLVFGLRNELIRQRVKSAKIIFNSYSNNALHFAMYL